MTGWRLAALLFLPGIAMAQQAPTPQDSAAQAAWAAGDWSAAARAYSILAARDTTRAQYRFRLGVALIGTDRHAEARPHLEAAERLGTPVPQAAFRLALAAAPRDLDGAFRELRRATDAGLSQLPMPAALEQDLARLKADARYAEFLTAMDRNARPCMHDDHHKEFDFWLGTWDVRPTGQPQAPPARNVITKVNNGCVVHESWTAPGSAGQSFNIYDRTRGKWFQIWVDNSGGLHEYAGGIREGAMVYEGEMPAPRPATGRVRTRLTFTPSARGVRQFSESTVDGGKTWRVNYDLFYTRADTGTAQPGGLTEADRREILGLDSAYVHAWLRDDTAGVVATLTPDAVLLPAGRLPLVGQEAIRAYWWPRDGSRTKILAFVSRVDEVGGTGDLAYLRGTDSLRFTYAKDAVRLDQRSRTMTLSVVKRGSDGRWRIARKMWGPYQP